MMPKLKESKKGSRGMQKPIKRIENIRMIDQIPKPKRDKVILMGSGKSIDNVVLSSLKGQKEYDILAITDAIKMFNPGVMATYTINYHYDGLRRIKEFLHLSKYVILPKGIFEFHIQKWERLNRNIDVERINEMVDAVNKADNCYYFISPNLKSIQVERGEFNKEFIDNTIYQAQGSAVGAFYFLVAAMRYKEIYYIGFDGSKPNSKRDDFEYGKRSFHPRKEHKIVNAGKSYQNSWHNLSIMRSFYPDLRFKPFNDVRYIIQ
ncbi:MAG: hypothetical protein ACOC3V_00145 [bacterium]